MSRNGYQYEIDGANRTRRVSGNLTTNTAQTRSQAAQRTAGVPDRLQSDHGGHYVARRFNGPTNDFNHFAQDANFNRSAYAALENQWAAELRSGRTVWVDIRPAYVGNSRRPFEITVVYRVNGGPRRRQVFPNRRNRRNQ